MSPEPVHVVLWRRVRAALLERGALPAGNATEAETAAFAAKLLGTDLVRRFVDTYYNDRVYGSGASPLGDAQAEALVADLEALPQRAAGPSPSAAARTAAAPQPSPRPTPSRPTRVEIATDLEEAVGYGWEEAARATARRKAAEEAALAAQKAETDRLAREAALAAQQAERERLAREAALAAEKAENERLAREAALAAEKAEAERRAHDAALAAQRAERERLEREAALAAQKAEAERRAREAARSDSAQPAGANVQRDTARRTPEPTQQRAEPTFQRVGPKAKPKGGRLQRFARSFLKIVAIVCLVGPLPLWVNLMLLWTTRPLTRVDIATAAVPTVTGWFGGIWLWSVSQNKRPP